MFVQRSRPWVWAFLAPLLCLFLSGHAASLSSPSFDLAPKNIVIVSVPASGHANPLVVLAYELADRGHNVTFVTSVSYNILEYARNSTIHFHRFVESLPFSENINEVAKLQSTDGGFVTRVMAHTKAVGLAARVMTPYQYDIIKEVVTTVKPGTVDLIIGDVFSAQAADILSQVLGTLCICHYFSITTTYYNPRNVFVENLYLTIYDGGADPVMTTMSVLKRLPGKAFLQFVSGLRLKARRQLYEKAKAELAQYLPATEKPAQPIISLVSNAWGFHPAQLAVPSTRMAGIWVPEAQSLDVQPDLKHWLDGASRPVVYVSTGTVAHPSNETLLAFYEAFSAATEFQTLWSLKKVFQNNLRELLGDQEWPEHVRIESFVPQLAVLDHPAVQIFFTHGGWNSVSEGLWTGTPMLGMPFFGDQTYNVAQTVRLGLGLMIDKNIMSSPDKAATIQLIQDKLHTILRDPSFSSRSKHFQKTFQVMGGVKKGANIVEEILAIGDTTVYSFPDNTNAVMAAMAILGLVGAAVTFGIYRLGAWGLGRLLKKRTPSAKAKAE